MTVPLTLSTKTVNKSSYDRIADILSPICKPLSEAMPGDILGVLITLNYLVDGDVLTAPIKSFVRRDDEGVRVLGWYSLAWNEDEAASLALCFARLSQCDFQSVFMPAVGALSSGEGRETMSLLLTRSGGILAIQNFQKEIVEPRSWERAKPCQEDIDDCLQIVLPAAANAHEHIGQTREANHLFNLARQLHPIRWMEDDPVSLQFRMPWLAPAERQTGIR